MWYFKEVKPNLCIPESQAWSKLNSHIKTVDMESENQVKWRTTTGSRAYNKGLVETFRIHY